MLSLGQKVSKLIDKGKEIILIRTRLKSKYYLLPSTYRQILNKITDLIQNENSNKKMFIKCFLNSNRGSAL